MKMIVKTGAKHFDQETLNQRLIAAGWEGLKAKEIANGRLAMVAFAGIMVQYDHTGVGPIANLASHLADPANNNVFKAAFVSF